MKTILQALELQPGANLVCQEEPKLSSQADLQGQSDTDDIL